MKTAAELKNVSFSYGEDTGKILDNADFRINYGEITLLSGDSGQGKSTVLSLICGIIPNLTPGVLDGEITVDSESTKDKPLREICRKVGVVLQNADSQIIQQTVEDEIAFGCENFNFSPESIKELIKESCEAMSLSPERQTRTLSGGQKQRLITASTLATRQKILILDEPLANLDFSSSVQLMKTLKSLAENGYAVLIIEHRTDLVADYADRICEISGGKVYEIENTKEFSQSKTGIIPDTAENMNSGETAFSIKSVSFSINKKEIIKDLSADISKGDRILLMGENGCGKTTLLRLLARLYKPTDGEIIQSILSSLKKGKTSKEWFRSVGVVYQNPDYQLFMPTVRTEIEYNAFSKEYADKMIELFGFSSLESRHPQSLSEGQKRRLSIAAVLASKPRVLLLDEPTVGQDYNGLKKMTDILNAIHKDTGNTMITVTHDKRCAPALCDKAFLIENGTIAKSGGKEFVEQYFGITEEKQ
ncbi:MAG: ATP-binding cassette domain-containing protein [Clostridia bacterium]|nr:ATP-binding cassette domain-containing protein [Clostridia bacterium]